MLDDATTSVKRLLNKSEQFTVLNKSDRPRHRRRRRRHLLFLHFCKEDDLRLTERPKPFQRNGSF